MADVRSRVRSPISPNVSDCSQPVADSTYEPGRLRFSLRTETSVSPPSTLGLKNEIHEHFPSSTPRNRALPRDNYDVPAKQAVQFPTLANVVAAAPATPAATERGPVRMIRFVLLDTGLYPREMRVNAGLINLAVEDETGISEGLVVERIINNSRERLTTIRRLPDAKRGRELMRLTPGQYVIYDASKPNNKANLIVEP